MYEICSRSFIKLLVSYKDMKISKPKIVIEKWSKKFIYWDVWIIPIAVVGNAVFNLIFSFIVYEKTIPSNINAIYEKVNICLTSTSILLAAVGLVCSGNGEKERYAIYSTRNC